MGTATQKQVVTNICGVAIIYRASDPSQVFIEVKDDGYPMARFRRCLCLIGGNWIGLHAAGDLTTRRTLEREIDEELSLTKGVASTLELKLLGLEPKDKFYVTPKNDLAPNEEDFRILNEIKKAINEGLVHFGDFILKVPKSVLDAADPENKRDGLSAIASYWTVGLSEETWEKLSALQKKFGNLSNESVTLLTSIDEIIATGTEIAFGHDRPLQRFFEGWGLENAKNLLLIEGITSVPIENPPATYAEYLERFEVQKRP